MVKVATHCEHDMIGAVVTSLKENHLDERFHTLINIVVKQTLVILKIMRGGERREREREKAGRGDVSEPWFAYIASHIR